MLIMCETDELFTYINDTFINYIQRLFTSLSLFHRSHNTNEYDTLRYDRSTQYTSFDSI